MAIELGAHIDQLDPIVEAEARSAEIVQIFLGDPQGWKGPKVNFPGGAAALKQAAEDAGIGIYVHAPYIINVASTNNRVRIPSRKLLQQQVTAAAEIDVKGIPLAERLYVPEPFQESTKADSAQRRREKLAILQPQEGHAPLALVIGEFKACDHADHACRIWIRHMPDAPLLMPAKSWERLARVHAPLLEARDADTGRRVRLMIAALIRARREFTYEIDGASLMLVSDQWIPLEGVHECPLLDELVGQQRRFLKPLRYDAPQGCAFPNVLVLDGGSMPIPLYIVSAFAGAKERAAKERAIAKGACWAWWTDQPMPALPAPTA